MGYTTAASYKCPVSLQRNSTPSHQHFGLLKESRATHDTNRYVSLSLVLAPKALQPAFSRMSSSPKLSAHHRELPPPPPLVPVRLRTTIQSAAVAAALPSSRHCSTNPLSSRGCKGMSGFGMPCMTRDSSLHTVSLSLSISDTHTHVPLLPNCMVLWSIRGGK